MINQSEQLNKGDKIENKHAVWVVTEKTPVGYNARKIDGSRSETTVFFEDLKYFNRV